MLTVIHLNNSRSTRLLFALEEAGIPYKIEAYERDPKTRLGPQAELEKHHPLGKAPILILDDGTAIAESGAIIEYIMRQPQGSKLRPSEDYVDLHASLMHMAEGTLMLHTVAHMYLGRVLPKDEKTPAILQQMVGHNLQRECKYLEGVLGEKDYFCGAQLTGADAMLVYSVDSTLCVTDPERKNYPRLAAYVKRVRDRPAFKRAVEKGGDLECVPRVCQLTLSFNVFAGKSKI